MTRALMLSCFLVALLVGCAQQPPPPVQNPTPPGAPKGIQVNVPGANVNVDPKGGVKVEAPGVKVETGDKGVKVEAPNVEVELPKVKIESK